MRLPAPLLPLLLLLAVLTACADGAGSGPDASQDAGDDPLQEEVVARGSFVTVDGEGWSIEVPEVAQVRRDLGDGVVLEATWGLSVVRLSEGTSTSLDPDTTRDEAFGRFADLLADSGVDGFTTVVDEQDPYPGADVSWDAAVTADTDSERPYARVLIVAVDGVVYRLEGVSEYEFGDEIVEDVFFSFEVPAALDEQ